MAQASLKLGMSLAIAALTLGGCAATPPERTANAERLPALRVFPGSLLLPDVGVDRRRLVDTCGAAALAGLVGRPRTQIPVPVDLSRRRVACTACPVAPDVKLDRVNILFDAQTGVVTRITCG